MQFYGCCVNRVNGCTFFYFLFSGEGPQVPTEYVTPTPPTSTKCNFAVPTIFPDVPYNRSPHTPGVQIGFVSSTNHKMLFSGFATNFFLNETHPEGGNFHRSKVGQMGQRGTEWNNHGQADQRPIRAERFHNRPEGRPAG